MTTEKCVSCYICNKSMQPVSFLTKCPICHSDKDMDVTIEYHCPDHGSPLAICGKVEHECHACSAKHLEYHSGYGDQSKIIDHAHNREIYHNYTEDPTHNYDKYPWYCYVDKQIIFLTQAELFV